MMLILDWVGLFKFCSQESGISNIFGIGSRKQKKISKKSSPEP
jgi:hypothetical protein